MKKFKLFYLFALTLIFIVTSCVIEETKKCESDHYGTVRVTNLTGESWNFDVTYEQNINTDWLTNKEVNISDNEYYKWDNVESGKVLIWVQNGNLVDDWQVADSLNLGDCENYTITYSSNCDLLNTGTAYVINNTGVTLTVDVGYTDGTYIGEQTLANNQTATFLNVKSGSIKFAAKPADSDSWSFSEYKELSTCDSYRFTWNAEKVATGKKGPKVNNASKTIKLQKVAK